MAGVAKVAIAVVLIAMVANVRYTTESAVTCELVVSRLTPCASYLIKGGPVPKSCCTGVQSLYKDADTTTDRQTACRCLEQAATLVPGINVDNAVNLPAKCDVSIPYKISPVFNCSTVQ
ncbi:non-specific lipid-transfer protein 1-like [Cynara cardunculus var. scolymus]|uniref:non-specific lipid-transfer protein 1-like n=1 Tax=Cynara cardunculus var. scolymus TaxID=59895 RepID=UPI000D62CDC4|nr:non-specific lipid-transfer protein 1-like [Cynara cardunculus var. scolymus]